MMCHLLQSHVKRHFHELWSVVFYCVPAHLKQKAVRFGHTLKFMLVFLQQFYVTFFRNKL